MGLLLKQRQKLWGMIERFASRQANKPIYYGATGQYGEQWGVQDGKVDVQHNIGLNTGFVHKCINIRANTQASVMLQNQHLYYYSNPTTKEEVSFDHPYFQVLRYVNEYHTPYDLWKFTASSMDFIGYCPWWVETDNTFGADVPVRINPIFPDMGRFIVKRNKFGAVTGYELHGGMEKIPFEPNEIFYHTDVNVNDSTYGLGLVNSMIREANIDKLQKQRVLKILQNGGLGKAHVQFKGNFEDTVFNRKVALFKKFNSGFDRENDYVFSDDGTDVNALVDNSALERAVAILGLTRDQIINLSGVMRASFEATNKADAFIQRVVYMEDTITPLILNLTSRLSQDFVQRYYPQDTGWLSVECDSIIPGDEVEKQTIREFKLRNAQAKPNDFLIEDGMEPSKDPAMDKYYIQAGLVPVGDNSLDFTDLKGSNP